MPFALTLIGLILVITGFQNTYKQFGTQLQNDFSGDNNFIYWVASIGIVGGIGYIKSFETFSRAFMALILLALILNLYKKNPNFFSDLETQLKTGSTSAVNPVGAPLPTSGSGGGGGSGDGFGLSDIANDVSILSGLGGFF